MVGERCYSIFRCKSDIIDRDTVLRYEWYIKQITLYIGRLFFCYISTFIIDLWINLSCYVEGRPCCAYAQIYVILFMNPII